MAEQRVIIMHGFPYEEIDRVMRAVKGEFPPPRDIIFAKTTENSLTMKVADLIEDLTEDHTYLKENPPDFVKKQRKKSDPASANQASSGPGDGS